MVPPSPVGVFGSCKGETVGIKHYQNNYIIIITQVGNQNNFPCILEWGVKL